MTVTHCFRKDGQWLVEIKRDDAKGPHQISKISTTNDLANIQYGGRKLLQSISSFILNLCSSAKSYHSVRKVWSFHKCLLSYVRNVWRFCRAYRSNKDLLPSLIGVPMSHPLVHLRHPGIEYGLISGEAF